MEKEDTSTHTGKFGYVRGDTHAELDRQTEVLIKYMNLDNVFSDLVRISKNDWGLRNSIINRISKGSTLFVESIIYISNSPLELVELLNILKAKGVKFVAINECIETATLYGRGMTDILCGAIEVVNTQRKAETGILDTNAVRKLIKGVRQIEKKYKVNLEQKRINYSNQYNKVTGINIEEIRLGE